MTKKLSDQETDKDEMEILRLFTYFPTNGLLVKIFLRHVHQSVIFRKDDCC